MATGTVTVLQDCRVYADEIDLSGQANEVGSSGSSRMNDKTSFDSGGWEESEPGLRKGVITVQTYLSEALNGTALEEGTLDVVVTLTDDNAEFSNAYGLKSHVTERGNDWPVGELVAQPLSFDGSGVFFAGSLLLPKAAQTSAGSGNGSQLGAVSADQSVYANLHVFDVTGGNVIARIESDDNSGFSSAATRHTFSTFTGVGAETAQVAGAITDDYWRIAWTQTASSATFAVALGIQ